MVAVFFVGSPGVENLGGHRSTLVQHIDGVREGLGDWATQPNKIAWGPDRIPVFRFHWIMM